MKTQRFHECSILAVALVLSQLVSPAFADGPDEKAVAKAKQLLANKDKQRLVAFFAHPTAKLENVEFLEIIPGDKSFSLRYKLSFTSNLKRPFYSKLALEFDIDGNYRGVDAIATSSFVQPFTASGVVIKMVQNRLKEKPLLRTKEVSLLIDQADVRGLLKVMLIAADMGGVP